MNLAIFLLVGVLFHRIALLGSTWLKTKLKRSYLGPLQILTVDQTPFGRVFPVNRKFSRGVIAGCVWVCETVAEDRNPQGQGSLLTCDSFAAASQRPQSV